MAVGKNIFFEDGSKLNVDLVFNTNDSAFENHIANFFSLVDFQHFSQILLHNSTELTTRPQEFLIPIITQPYGPQLKCLKNSALIDCLKNGRFKKKFKLNGNPSLYAKSIRNEKCALNLERFLILRTSEKSLSSIKYGESKSFSRAIEDFEDDPMAIDVNYLERDLDEIFQLLIDLQNGNFAGPNSPIPLKSLIVVTNDCRLKLVVPCVINTRIEETILEFPEFKAEISRKRFQYQKFARILPRKFNINIPAPNANQILVIKKAVNSLTFGENSFQTFEFANQQFPSQGEKTVTSNSNYANIQESAPITKNTLLKTQEESHHEQQKSYNGVQFYFEERDFLPNRPITIPEADENLFNSS